MADFLKFLYSQLLISLPEPKASFAGETVIVTGSNTGLGLEAARYFSRLHAAKVILAVRDLKKGEAARQSILKTASADPSSVEVWHLDLGSYGSVISFAERASQLPRIDHLVENAGIAALTFRMAEDNESTITVNVVSTFLLALLLMPKLKETAKQRDTPPSLTIVSSEVHAFTPFVERNEPEVFQVLNDIKTANMGDRYQVSKLLEVLVVREWASQLPQYPVTINLVNPGLCHSELSREAGIGLTIMKMLLARSTEHGSRTLVHGAMQGRESHGMYLADCKIAQPSPFVISDEGKLAQVKVWGELKAKLEKIRPGVTKNL